MGWSSYPIARLNGDPAAERVKADLARWGVKLNFAERAPTNHTPIVVQEIRHGMDGQPRHRFSLACPHCGHWLPSFKSVTLRSVEPVAASMRAPSVFFMDRLSQAALILAETASKQGALVVFEPSGRTNHRLLAEALRLAHVVKYAGQRSKGLDGVMSPGTATLLEIQTFGADGLRFRRRLHAGTSDWEHLAAVRAPVLADTCGSGDWCTAGFLTRTATHGKDEVAAAGDFQVRDALRYGQALAAWNCGFEGARGGMYAVNASTFKAQIDCIT